MAELAPRRSPLLGPRWADRAEILHGKRARVWLLAMQILLGWVEVGGHSGQKTEKKSSKTAVFGPGCPVARPIARPCVGGAGRNFTW